MIDTEKLLEVAKEAAYEAGEIQMRYFGKKKEINYKSNAFDLVTNADKASEEKIISVIKSYCPDHGILGEESGESNNKESDYTWVIDPIDGTTNYAHNFPHFAASIGMLYKGERHIGVVLDPFKNELFWAAKGTGAYLNAEPIEPSDIKTVNRALLATGFPYERSDVLELNLVHFKNFSYKSQAIRRPGAASLDLCYVACGRFDGYWEFNLSPWDVAAGALIIEEAGGKIINFNSDKYDFNIKNCLASNKYILEEMHDIILEVD